jgi:hypothetical protein
VTAKYIIVVICAIIHLFLHEIFKELWISASYTHAYSHHKLIEVLEKSVLHSVSSLRLASHSTIPVSSRILLLLIQPLFSLEERHYVTKPSYSVCGVWQKPEDNGCFCFCSSCSCFELQTPTRKYELTLCDRAGRTAEMPSFVLQTSFSDYIIIHLPITRIPEIESVFLFFSTRLKSDEDIVLTSGVSTRIKEVYSLGNHR